MDPSHENKKSKKKRMKSSPCEIHRGFSKIFYCASCRMTICSECLSNHTGHRYMKLSEISQDLSLMLTKKHETLHKKIKHLESEKNIVMPVYKAIKDQFNFLVHKIIEILGERLFAFEKQIKEFIESPEASYAIKWINQVEKETAFYQENFFTLQEFQKKLQQGIGDEKELKSINEFIDKDVNFSEEVISEGEIEYFKKKMESWGETVLLQLLEQSNSSIIKYQEEIADLKKQVFEQKQDILELKRASEETGQIVEKYTSNNKSNTNREETKGEIKHAGIRCSSCGKIPIEGPRYACFNCDSYNLCQKCVGKNNHKHMLFEIMKTIMPTSSISPLAKPHSLNMKCEFSGFGDRAEVKVGQILKNKLILCNNGENRWPRDTCLFPIDSKLEFELSPIGPVASGEKKDVWVQIKAPRDPGIYKVKFMLRADSMFFGNEINFEINVTLAESLSEISKKNEKLMELSSGTSTQKEKSPEPFSGIENDILLNIPEIYHDNIFKLRKIDPTYDIISLLDILKAFNNDFEQVKNFLNPVK